MIICLVVISCRGRNNEDDELAIDVQSVSTHFKFAEELSNQWNKNAELVTTRFKYFYSHDAVIEDVVEFEFEAQDDNEFYLIVRCEEEDCVTITKKFYVTQSGEILSLLQKGWTPIELNKYFLDSDDIVKIAKTAGSFDLNAAEYNIGASLVRETDNSLIWVVTYSSLSHFIEVKIEPFNGTVLDIKN
jgi:hypothetical protein